MALLGDIHMVYIILKLQFIVNLKAISNEFVKRALICHVTVRNTCQMSFLNVSVKLSCTVGVMLQNTFHTV